MLGWRNDGSSRGEILPNPKDFSTPGRLSGLRILVAEDHWIEADTLCVRLEEEGAQAIGPFRHATDAIAALAQHRVDFALVDMVLQDTTADPLLRELTRRSVPHGVITGYSALPTNATESASLHLLKPVQWDFLFDSISDIVRP